MKNCRLLMTIPWSDYNVLDSHRKPASMQDYIRYIISEWCSELRQADELQQTLFESESK